MKLLKRMIKGEAGQALPMALVLLVLGGLLIVPILSFMTTNLTAHRMVDVKTSATYAADAGIQDALWKLGNGVEPFADNASYVLTENGNPVILNGMTVTVEEFEATQASASGYLYSVKSTASLDGEPKAVITAQAHAGASFHWLFDNALTSAGNVEIGSDCIIYGDVIAGGQVTGDTEHINGTIHEDATVIMPTENMLTAFYRSSFNGTVCADPANYCPANPYTSSTYTIPPGYTYANPYIIPWLYCDNGYPDTYKLSLVSGGGDTYAKLRGNIFVNGKFP